MNECDADGYTILACLGLTAAAFAALFLAGFLFG